MPTVLILDDVAEIVEELIELLGLVDIIAVGAGTIEEAIAALQRNASIQVIICDLRLSHESGTDMVVRVEADPMLAPRGLRYIFLTGDPELLDAGFDGLVLSKPAQPRALIASIKEMLASDGAAA